MTIILSDVEGLYTADPQEPGAELIKTVEAITPQLKSSLNGKSKLGRGGIQSKIKAALLDRLALDQKKIQTMAKELR